MKKSIESTIYDFLKLLYYFSKPSQLIYFLNCETPFFAYLHNSFIVLPKNFILSRALFSMTWLFDQIHWTTT